MPQLRSNLEAAVRRATEGAACRGHEYVTLEHLLYALAREPDAVELLEACGVDVVRLRVDLERFIATDLAGLAVRGLVEPGPTASFARVMARAGAHCRAAGLGEVGCAHVIVAMFSERESHAVAFLADQGMDRADAVGFVAHGLRKRAPAPAPADAGDDDPFARLRHRLGRGVVLSLRRPGADDDEEENDLADLALLAEVVRRDAAWAWRVADAAAALGPAAAPGEAIEAVIEAVFADVAGRPGQLPPPAVRVRHARRAADGLRMAVAVDAEPPVAALLAALWLARTSRAPAVRGELEDRLPLLLGGDPERLAPLVRAFVSRPTGITAGDERVSAVLPPRPRSRA